jgi:hypothetical protein
MKCHWLKCKVSPGQFSEEVVVEATDFRNRGFSLFVPDNLVEPDTEPRGGKSVDGWLQVDVLGQQDAWTLIRLPRAPLENGPTVTVQTSQLDYRVAKELA